jgi:predicted metalloprotease
VRFRSGARLDPSQVEDRRGVRGPIAVGGGGLGAVGVIVYILFAVLGGGSGGTFGGLDGISIGPGSTGAASAQLDCTTGADANERQDCRILGDVNSVQKYWSDWFKAHGKTYTQAKTVFFTGSTSTGCGSATTDVGPFYCPVDKQVYIDLGFYEELHDRFGAQGGPFAVAYVIAHEYGHHTQDLLGDLSPGGSQGAESRSVRTELQADCYAGAWARNAVATGYIVEITDADVASGLDAAAAVGDDRIQKQAQGRISPDTWTHGSAAQRQSWFKRGFQRGEPSGCDTFSGSL